MTTGLLFRALNLWLIFWMLFRLYYGLLPDERTIAALSMLACYCYVYDWVNTHTNDTLESHEEELMTSSSFCVDPKKSTTPLIHYLKALIIVAGGSSTFKFLVHLLVIIFGSWFLFLISAYECMNIFFLLVCYAKRFVYIHNRRDIIVWVRDDCMRGLLILLPQTNWQLIE